MEHVINRILIDHEHRTVINKQSFVNNSVNSLTNNLVYKNKLQKFKANFKSIKAPNMAA